MLGETISNNIVFLIVQEDELRDCPGIRTENSELHELRPAEILCELFRSLYIILFFRFEENVANFDASTVL